MLKLTYFEYFGENCFKCPLLLEFAGHLIQFTVIQIPIQNSLVVLKPMICNHKFGNKFLIKAIILSFSLT